MKMASNNEYEQQQFWQKKSWLDECIMVYTTKPCGEFLDMFLNVKKKTIKRDKDATIK